jgi:hypothetical protein
MRISGFGLSTVLGFLLAALAPTPAAAQSTYDDWLALRTRKQARHHRLPLPATQPASLTITAIRFFSDASGQLVGVGEARNHTGEHLTYSRLNFRFLDAEGAELGRVWTYLHGGTNMRVVATGAFETALAPGETGFFKVWTEIPAQTMTSYTVETAGESLALAPPIAAGLVHANSPWWYPLRIVDQRVDATVVHDDFQGPGCLCGHPQIFASAVQLSVAAYQGGVIADVQSVIVRGPTHAASCSAEPWATGLFYRQTVRVGMDLAQPADSILRHAVEWDENEPAAAASPSILVFDELAGEQTFTTNHWCGAAPIVSAPWITITEATGAGGSGRVTLAVPPNTGTSLRRATVSLPDISVLVIQTRACLPLEPTTIVLPAGRVDGRVVGVVPSDCTFASGSQSTVAWLRAFESGGKLYVSAEPNMTGSTRSGVVTWRRQSFTVHQSPAQRRLDFNGDGGLDLLWFHRTAGWVAAWLMNGLQLSAGTLLSWNKVDDLNWTPAVVADFDRDGSADIVWQHVDGTLALWRLNGTQVIRNDELQRQASPLWKLRAASDFNGDGDPDYVWQHDATGEIQIWYMRAGRFPFSSFDVWSSPSILQSAPLGPGVVADLNWKIVGSGDFNRDGSPDLVWQHDGDGRVAVWKMQRAALVEGGLISPDRVADLNWKLRAVGDINGDDMPDLIWQHRTDGRIAAWLMNGTERIYGVVIAQLADTQWEIVGPR